jgi:type IV pilus assembly protein PilF
MIKTVYKLSSLMTVILMLNACQTTSDVRSSSVSLSKGTINGDFDRNKAAQIRLSAGLQYLKTGHLLNAKRHLDKALELGANSGNVHFGIAYYFEKVKEFDKAENSYQKALGFEKNNPDFLNGYASFLCVQGDFTKAQKYFTKAIEQPIYADIASAYMNAGVCAKRSNLKQIAASYFRKALNRNNKLPTALIEMAEVEFDKLRYERAHSYIQRYEEVSRPSSSSLWLALRIASLRKNKNDLATYAIKLEQMFPDSEETAEFLDNKNQWM